MGHYREKKMPLGIVPSLDMSSAAYELYFFPCQRQAVQSYILHPFLWQKSS